MTVRYIRQNLVANQFAPAVRAFGNIAVIGKIAPPAQSPPADLAAVNTPVDFTDPAEALRRAPGDLGQAIALALTQSPGPSLVTGVRVSETSPNFQAALDVVAGLDVQLVVLANTPMTAANTAVGNPNATPPTSDGPVVALAKHVVSVSETGADGRQRIGVAMLPKDSADPSVVSGALSTDRMVYIAHRSTQDAAAAVAGTIAGYEPHVTLLLKQVAITSPSFTQAQIEAINGSENFGSGPAAKNGVNWLASPALIPGNAVYLGEGYTGNPGGITYIDARRYIDGLSFQLNARLIRSIGNVRITRAGLRALIAQIEAILGPQQQADILTSFEVSVPLLALLDRDPATLTAAEAQRVHDAETQRLVQILVAVNYAGQVHRMSLTVTFN
ncbi:hypothetical protein [Actinomadura fibrosa]|uniref:Phage tail protein n=1 Tax=Actinomadura fibrosa TaxID=111802 RepID=A0ABW2XN50_9ACTN|nr:hypothetical protein [Actinomadura fibrosa]